MLNGSLWRGLKLNIPPALFMEEVMVSPFIPLVFNRRAAIADYARIAANDIKQRCLAVRCSTT